MPTVLGHQDLGSAGTSQARKRRVEERGILMGMDEFDLPSPKFICHSFGYRQIQSRFALKIDQRNPLSNQLLAKLAHRIQTEKRRLNGIFKPVDNLSDEHFCACNLHRMQAKPYPQFRLPHG